MAAKALTVHTSGNSVYIHDERGALVDVFSFPQPPTQVQSFGNGVSITCGTLCYTYTLDDKGKLVQNGLYGI